MSALVLRFSRVCFGLGVGALLLACSGCSDLITFADKNREAGLVAYKDQRYADAAGGFRAALREDPRDYRSHYYLGMCSLQLGSYQQAIVAFRSSLDTRNSSVAGQQDTETSLKALDGLAQAIVKSDDSDHEVVKVEQTARNAKGAAAAQEFFILGKVHRYRMLPDMAMDHYGRACLADNTNFDYLKEYGLYLEQLQQRAKAEQSLRQAYALNPRDEDVTQALVRLGVVPGPSLRNRDDLARPIIPKGPIPEVDMKKVKSALGIERETPLQPKSGSNTAVTPHD